MKKQVLLGLNEGVSWKSKEFIVVHGLLDNTSGLMGNYMRYHTSANYQSTIAMIVSMDLET